MREWYRWVYLKSPHWIALRRCKLDQDPSCAKCRVAPASQVHHVNYRSIYDVTLPDLLSLCNRCHSKMHGKAYNDPKPYWRFNLRPPVSVQVQAQRNAMKAAADSRKAAKKRKRARAVMTPSQLRALENLLERGRL